MKAKKLQGLFQELAEELGVHYLDLSSVKPSVLDGLHYDEEGHKLVSTLIFNKIKKIL